LLDINTAGMYSDFSVPLTHSNLLRSFASTQHSMPNRWSLDDPNQGSAFHELVVLPTVAPELVRPYVIPGTAGDNGVLYAFRHFLSSFLIYVSSSSSSSSTS
jgi:hypothetical protein